MDCIVEGCAKPRRTYMGKVCSSMCTTHTSRKQRHGGTEAYAKKPGVPLGWNGKASMGTNGYLWVHFYGVRIMVHHLVYFIENGVLPRGKHIHHKDGNRFNNHPDNLEAMSPSEHHRLHRGN